MGVDGNVHTVDSGHSAFYTNFSGWDIYRTQAQLEALVDPSAASDTAESMVDDYAQDGMFPKWMQNNGETYVMVGDPADSIIADYYAFGATNFNTSAALADMVAEGTNTNNIRPGLNYLNEPGYLPDNGSYGCCNFYGADVDHPGVRHRRLRDLRVRRGAGQHRRPGHVRGPGAGLAQRPRPQLRVRPAAATRTATGLAASTPTSGNNFVEADSWIYTGMVPFDLAGLTAAKGGDAAMNAYLGTSLRSYTGANGYAWVGNEPSIELPWEYDYTGEPYQAQATVRQIQDQIWTDTPSGLADGNDDLGAMSAWYVWSALGMYPMTPGTPTLALGSPMFTQAVVTLPSGNTLTINGNGAADNAPYVQSATWNGGSWNNAYAPTSAITSGGTLTYALGTTADTSWAAGAAAAPPSYSGNTVAPPDPRVGPVTAGVGTGLCVDDASSSTTPGNPVQIYGCNGSDAQSWTIGTDGTIRTLGLCLDVLGQAPPVARRPTSTPAPAPPASSGRPGRTAPWSTPPPACAWTTPPRPRPRAPSSRSTPATAPPPRTGHSPPPRPPRPAPSPPAWPGCAPTTTRAAPPMAPASRSGPAMAPPPRTGPSSPTQPCASRAPAWTPATAAPPAAP